MIASAFRTAICGALAALAATAIAQEAKPAAPAEAAKPKPAFKFEFHGFIGGSVAMQDAVLSGVGGAVSYVTATPNADRLSFIGDVRQSRINFSISGPQVLTAVPKGVVEMDFATSVATGQFAFAQPSPRLRLCYAELNWGGGAHILRFGQDSDLVQGGIAPASVGHISTNLAYTVGYIGFRHPGIFFFETIPLAPDYKLELAVQVTKSQWDDSQTDINTTTLSYADDAGTPMVEARAKVKSKIFEAYISGHWNHVDFKGVGGGVAGQGACTGTTSSCGERDVIAGNAGLKVTYAGATLQGSGYYGKNAGAFNGGDIGQRQDATRGDSHSYGFWGQAGYNITPELSAWYLIGTGRMVNYNDVAAALGNSARLNNLTQSGMIRYQENGYAIGLEYVHFRTLVAKVAPTSISGIRSPNGVLDANQLMLSGFYFF